MDPDGCRVWVLNNSPEIKANADRYAVVGKDKKEIKTGIKMKVA